MFSLKKLFGKDEKFFDLLEASAEEAKAGGLVKEAIERAGLRGVVVAPLK